MRLRNYQQEAVDKIKARLAAGVNRQLLKFATGTGKTPLFSSLPDQLNLKGRMLVVDHREELTNQALDKLKKWNPARTVGVEMGNRRSDGEQIVVAGNATIGRKGSPRLTQFNPQDFDIIVVDEAHHATAQSYRTIFEHFRVFEDKHRLLLGVTATPNRADGIGLGEVFQEIVDDKDILYGINNGWLADLHGIRIKTGVSLNGVHNKVGDFDQQELGTTVNTPERNDLIVRSWLEHAKDRQTVVFTVNIQHAKDLADTFQKYGVAAEGIWGNDPDRAEKLKCHGNGSITVLTNCALLTEGYDDWRVSCIGDAAPTQSESRYTQKIGRGTRIPGNIDNLLTARAAGLVIEKEDCIILDFVDATSKHSLVTLPTLFGMGSNTNLHGKPLSKVVAEIAQLKLNNPLLDISKIEDASQLKSYAEQIDLFKGGVYPEVTAISNLLWHKVSAIMYILSLPNGEHLTVASDILGVWHIMGSINECKVNDSRTTIDDAIREADYKITILGNRFIKAVVSRAAKWNNDAPTARQLLVCKQYKVVIPQGATKGEVALKLTEMFNRCKDINELRKVFA